MTKFTAILAAAVFLAAASSAIAQSCAPVGATQRCISAHPNNYVDQRQPGQGGQVGCPATAANTVQIDVYTPGAGMGTYYCTTNVACSSLPPSNPFHQRFC